MQLTQSFEKSDLGSDFPLPADRPFTLGQARMAGVPRKWIRQLVATGQLRHPIRDCYVPAALPDTLETRAACLQLVSPPQAVLVDRHAAWLHGADMVLRPGEHLAAMPITMFLPAGRGRLRSKHADSGERTFLADDLTEVHGLKVTTPLRTALDLGRQRWPEPALTALDALHRVGGFALEHLLAELPRFRGMRWIRTLRLVAPHTDGRSQSAGETAIRWRWLHLPVPPPQPQVQVTSQGRVAFIDVGNEEHRVGVEYDGERWHSTSTQIADDAARRRWLAQDAGWSVRALVSRDVYGPHSTVESAIISAFRLK